MPCWPTKTGWPQTTSRESESREQVVEQLGDAQAGTDRHPTAAAVRVLDVVVLTRGLPLLPGLLDERSAAQPRQAAGDVGQLTEGERAAYDGRVVAQARDTGTGLTRSNTRSIMEG
ncbi:hypothetical protein [Luteipulveratus halotolerans]|uniref:Uncharacterized protein n=1 Tax=Luteipulveratus halotolerans TaxID=1631356 RepID=A0A0L6CJE5_9MICO|nr:hypothetical protein [Luteipulveratus halotolerans]KNX37916.1 hypothetical protein VV01_13345 [Luteipulveratus halotolerans]